MNARLIALLICGLIYNQLAYSQTTGPGFFLRRYVTNIRLNSQTRFATGILYDMTDSTVTLATINGLKPKLNALISHHGGTLPQMDSVRRIIPLQTYRYSDIRQLTLYRRGHGGKGLLIGMGVGVLIGLLSGNDSKGLIRFTAGDKALAGGVLLGMSGLLIGSAIIYSSKAKEQSIATEVPRRFRKFSIVEQVNQANLYKP